MSTHMEAKIHAHIDRLFAELESSERVSEVKLELYMNTLDRYNDLLKEGMQPDEAYAEAIRGIGDVSEILESLGLPSSSATSSSKPARGKKLRRRLYAHFCNAYWMLILILYFLISFATSAWSVTWLIFLIATALLKVIRAAIDIRFANTPDELYLPSEEQKKRRSSIGNILWLVTLTVYLVVSFAIDAWHITWLVFLLGNAVESLLSMYFILKEHRNKQQGGQ